MEGNNYIPSDGEDEKDGTVSSPDFSDEETENYQIIT